MTDKQTLTLPWPPKGVRPNGPHGHWAAKASARRAYKTACLWTLKEQKARKMDAKALTATITFHPPSRRRMDLDNLVASLKAALDAIAQTVGVDDSKWNLNIRPIAEPRPKQGMVIVELEAAA